MVCPYFPVNPNPQSWFIISKIRFIALHTFRRIICVSELGYYDGNIDIDC